MQVDLLAGTTHRPAVLARPVPTILVFDSGLGGLTVLARVTEACRGADIVYAADDAGFPYGRLEEGALVARVLAVMERRQFMRRQAVGWASGGLGISCTPQLRSPV